MNLLEKWLKAESIVSSKQIQEARGAQREKGGSLGEQLIRLGFITPERYVEFFTKHTPFPMATFGMFRNVPPGITNILSADIIAHYHLFPLGVIGPRLQIAFLDPTDDVALSEVNFATGMEIEPYFANPRELFQAINTAYDLPTPSWILQTGVGEEFKAEEPTFESKFETEPIEEKFEPERPSEPKAGEESVDQLKLFEGIEGETPKPFKEPEPKKEEEVTKATEEPKPIIEEEKTEKIEKKIALVKPFPSPTSEVGGTEPVTPGAMSEEFQAISSPTTPDTTAKAPVEGSAKESQIELTPPPEPESLFTPEATTGTFDALQAKMEEVTSKEEVAEEVLGWLKKQPVSRGAIFVLQRGNIVGWRGFGPQLEGPSVGRIKISLEEPGIFSTAAETKEIYHGGILDSEVNAEFVRFLQTRPQEIYLVPSLLNERVFAMIFCEVIPGRTITPSKQLTPLAEALARGFATLIQHKKKSA
ncbi:hypothetical protein ACFLRA_03815 [Bdellovibrionota bacterium]